ncbi:hypothetical protein MKW98_024885 [Papaver atlanticum]|uniref:Uncharacterized protein n=1 Tax=Papaver atlanticum TaxID=357466 RepID=A0AAD4XSJ7_9MAGN|nr:hypothetical protein MKW98_024885 [Papaver atlanticum]
MDLLPQSLRSPCSCDTEDKLWRQIIIKKTINIGNMGRNITLTWGEETCKFDWFRSTFRMCVKAGIDCVVIEQNVEP